MKKDKSRFKVSINLLTATNILIIAGLVFVVITNILLNVFSENFLSKYYATKPILDIVNAIGSTLLSAGIVSVLVEISTIKGLISDAFNNVLQGNIPLDSYSNKILTKINKQIAAKRGNVAFGSIDDSIYSVEPKLIDLLDGLYYNYYNASYEITPDEERGVFKKFVTLDYEVVNECGKDNSVSHSIRLCNVKSNMTDEEKRNMFQIKSFTINKTDLTNEVDKYKNVVPIKEKHSEYQYTVTFRRELQHCKYHKIHLEFEYDVPLKDTSQIFRLTYPSKSMIHEIYINNNMGYRWKIHGAAFVSFYCKEDNNHGFHVKQKHDSDLQISFNNWCIPGAGYVAYLVNEKNN